MLGEYFDQSRFGSGRNPCIVYGVQKRSRLTGIIEIRALWSLDILVTVPSAFVAITAIT
jgi:hypothetical protein